MKHEKDNTIIVLALAAPGTKFKPPQTRKRKRASSSNGVKSNGASTAGPSGLVQNQDPVNNIQQNQEEPVGLNQQQPDLGLANEPQIPEEVAAGPADPEDMNDVFEFALNNNILDL
uniref:Uncharacterized protein n=1 Tax=Oryza punctata TaxID=4537 RepID=A0A0E0LS04_ORYPU